MVKLDLKNGEIRLLMERGAASSQAMRNSAHHNVVLSGFSKEFEFDGWIWVIIVKIKKNLHKKCQLNYGQVQEPVYCVLDPCSGVLAPSDVR